MLPPSLYSHLKAAGKDMIVVLNKVDLVPLPVAIAWKHSLLEAYPGIRRVHCLNTYVYMKAIKISYSKSLGQGDFFHIMPVVQPEARNRIVGGRFSGKIKAADEEAAWQDQEWHSRNHNLLCILVKVAIKS